MLNLYSMPSIIESLTLMRRRLLEILWINLIFIKTQVIFLEKWSCQTMQEQIDVHITQQSGDKLRDLWIWSKSLILIWSRTVVWTKDLVRKECMIFTRTYSQGRKHCCEMKWETEIGFARKLILDFYRPNPLILCRLEDK